MHEMPKPVFWEKGEKNIINLSSAEIAQRKVKVNLHVFLSKGNRLLYFRGHPHIPKMYQVIIF